MFDGQLAALVGLATLLSTTSLKMLDWWSSSRKQEAETKTSSEASAAALETQIQAVYGQIIHDLKVDVAYVREQEQACRRDMQALLRRVNNLERKEKQKNA